MTDPEAAIYGALREHDNKYTYFLLAGVGAAIAFALNQTHDTALSPTQLPLGLAVLCWAVSFYCGCKNLICVRRSLYENSELLRVKSGNHPLVGQNMLLISAASKIVEESFEKQSRGVSIYGRLQFDTLVGGAVLYIIWHVLEMYLKTIHGH